MKRACRTGQTHTDPVKYCVLNRCGGLLRSALLGPTVSSTRPNRQTRQERRRRAPPPSPRPSPGPRCACPDQGRTPENYPVPAPRAKASSRTCCNLTSGCAACRTRHRAATESHCLRHGIGAHLEALPGYVNRCIGDQLAYTIPQLISVCVTGVSSNRFHRRAWDSLRAGCAAAAGSG